MRLGEKHFTNQGYLVTIVEYFNSRSCSIKFEDGTILQNKLYGDVKNGNIKHLLHPTVCNVGYLGYGMYRAYEKSKLTKCYTIWHSMILRCFSKKYNKKHSSYQKVSVEVEWYNFQNFAEWYYENYNPEIMDDWHLDKDILIKGNKIYSPETCCFVPQEINKLFVKMYGLKRTLPVGVSVDKNKFVARLSKYRVEHILGYFNTPEEAFQVYKTAKEQYIKEVADKWKDQITKQIYNALINYKVEIDD